jgi:flagellar basal-body rod protein FlgB
LSYPQIKLPGADLVSSLYQSIIGSNCGLFSQRFAEGAMTGKLDDYLRFQETALNLRAQRQQLLASNIANGDTPNYKARDIDFNKALEGALSRNGQPASTGLVKTATAHLNGTSNSNAFGGAPLLYRTVQQGSVDNNTVDMDVERNQFTDNAVRYEASLTLISSQIKNMLAALQG